MNFLISDAFTDSLARLTGEEQKAVKTAAFDLQLNPANAGMSYYKLDKALDKNFWSVLVNGILLHAIKYLNPSNHEKNERNNYELIFLCS